MIQQKVPVMSPMEGPVGVLSTPQKAGDVRFCDTRQDEYEVNFWNNNKKMEKIKKQKIIIMK